MMTGNAGDDGDDDEFEAPEDVRKVAGRAEREQRSAAAMRANLRRRKVTVRNAPSGRERSVGPD